MIITMFLSKSYLMNRYGMSQTIFGRFTKEVLPNLINRLSMDDRIEVINLFSSAEFNYDLGYGSKVNSIVINSNDSSGFGDLIKLSLNATECRSEIVTVYNPLFPFISIEKIYKAYKTIQNMKYSSAIGVDHYYSKIFKDDVAQVFDAGILSIFRSSDFNMNMSRVNSPIKGIELSALELISLRDSEDYELYGLVVNSGLM